MQRQVDRDGRESDETVLYVGVEQNTEISWV